MPEEQTLTMRDVRPFWGRATLMESPVDDAQRPSGLIVPMGKDAGSDVKRGVLLHIDEHWDESQLVSDQLKPGMAVFYRGGVSIADVIVVEMNEILAYELEDDRG
jgi:hypothetical protein